MEQIIDFKTAGTNVRRRFRETRETAAWWEAVHTILDEGEEDLKKSAEKKNQLSWLLFVSPSGPDRDEEDIEWLQDWFIDWARFRKEDDNGP